MLHHYKSLFPNKVITRSKILPSIKISAAILLLIFSKSITSAQTISISGTIHDDGNGSRNGIMDGPGISSVFGQQLYVYAIDNSSVIKAKDTVKSNGTYSLLANANTGYSISLSSSSYQINTSNPNIGLPGGYASTGEGTTGSVGDGVPDFSIAINSNSNLSMDFAVDARPAGLADTLNPPIHFDSIRRVIFTDSLFQGSDLEDGTYTPGLAGRSIDLYQATNGDSLFYNDTLILFSSSNTATRINNFHDSLLRFKTGPPSNSLTHQFGFSIVDNAGVPEQVPNTILINSPLPITLLSFSGSAQVEGTHLNWSTTSEISNTGFEIQRSMNGMDFEKIGWQASNSVSGTTNGLSNYEYLDGTILSMNNTIYYYRLRQIDRDGAYTYSPIISVNKSSTKSTDPVIYPNPASRQLTISNLSGTQINMNLVNNVGTIVYKHSVENGADSRLVIDLSTIPAGNYYLNIVIDGTRHITQSVLILNN